MNHQNRSDDLEMSIKITGEYPDVLEKVTNDGLAYPEMEPFVDDLSAIFRALDRHNGLTRSQIIEKVGLDLEGPRINGLMKVLREYDLIRVDGKTWKLGSEFEK